MKRVGHVYEQMARWGSIVEAERVATARKGRNPGVRRHVGQRLRNLCEIQGMVLEGRMRTGDYRRERRVSGQDKVRDIARLHFHPSHIEHQLLTMAAERRIDRSLIRHTYASRRGMGQIRCALDIRRSLGRYRGRERWYGQGDIRRYYASIGHGLIRDGLEHLFKDARFRAAFMEPFERFAPGGVGIPLGIRPSQCVGNLVLSPFDRFMTEELRCADYKRYLDDFCFTGATKGEVKRKMKRAVRYLAERGFGLHEPKIRRVSEGMDMMGFVFDGTREGMWWRKSDKARWLRRRSGVTNPRRLRELDDAAWGMLKWGNSHCRRLWRMKTGREDKRKKDMVRIADCGIRRTERTDANGTPFIDAPKIGMQLLLGKPVELERWLPNIRTSQGEGRYAVLVRFMGERYKLIVNAADIKTFLADMTRGKVTRLRTVFVDRGGMRYGIDEERTEILEVEGRRVALGEHGRVVYEDDGTEVHFV